MAETQKKRSPVLLAFALFLMASVAFAAAFYYFDGVGLVTDLAAGDPVGDFVSWFEQFGIGRGEDRGSDTATETVRLRLPQGMSEASALRLWQEQIDSQANIRKLVNGDLKSLSVGAASYSGDTGQVRLTATFADDTSASGELHMLKAGDVWYVEYISGLRKTETGGLADTVRPGKDVPPETPLPTLGQVDVGVLNTLLAEQAESQEVFRDYLEGNVKRIVVTGVKKGPGTATIDVKMYEKDHTVDARIVAISKMVDYEETWFLAKFEKTKTTPK